jgi:hypothetical protein
MIVGALVLVEVTTGITEASTTRSRLEDDRWQVVHRHADALTQKREPA